MRIPLIIICFITLLGNNKKLSFFFVFTYYETSVNSKNIKINFHQFKTLPLVIYQHFLDLPLNYSQVLKVGFICSNAVLIDMLYTSGKKDVFL